MNTTNPWEIDNAFEPMYTEVVNVSAPRKDTTLRQTLKCCIFTDGTGETLYEGSTETDREDIMVVTRKGDWKFVQSLQTGDEIKRLSNDITYTISDVKKDAFWGWIITARGA